MIRLWQRIMSRLRKSSAGTIEAERRLQQVQHDDIKVNQSIRTGERIVRDNHLGPLIAQLFERPKL